jgi:general secretion pathway protein G
MSKLRQFIASRRRPGDRSGEAGFTLIELLVVLAILGLIAAIATPQVLKHLGKAKTDAAKVEIRTIGSALELFALDVGRFPSTQEGLSALVERPAGLNRWNGPYIRAKSAPIDAWGRPYLYRSPGEHGDYDLYTLGADGAPGGDGDNQDVVSW